MKARVLFRLGGIALLVSAVLAAIGNLAYFLSGEQATVLGLWSDVFNSIVLVLGLAALFARQSQAGGVLGLVGYLLLVCDSILFGISIYRARVLPKYAGALLIVVGVLNPLTGPLAFTRPIFAICTVVVWAWLGWSLLADQKAALSEPALAA